MVQLLYAVGTRFNMIQCISANRGSLSSLLLCFVPQTVYCWGSILERKELATLTGRALNSVAGLCGRAHAPERRAYSVLQGERFRERET